MHFAFGTSLLQLQQAGQQQQLGQQQGHSAHLAGLFGQQHGSAQAQVGALCFWYFAVAVAAGRAAAAARAAAGPQRASGGPVRAAAPCTSAGVFCS